MAEDPTSAPVLVMLPDASIRMFDCTPNTPVTAAEVLQDFPGCALSRVQDPRRSPLGQHTPLNPGATYFILAAQSASASPRGTLLSPQGLHVSKAFPEVDVTRTAASNSSTPLSRSPSGSASSESGWSSSSMASSTSSGHVAAPLARCMPVLEGSPSTRSREEDSWNLPTAVDSHLQYSMPFPPRPPVTPRTPASRHFSTAEDLCQLSLHFSSTPASAQPRGSQQVQLAKQMASTASANSQPRNALGAQRQLSVTADVGGAPLVSPRVPSPGSTIPPLPRARTSHSPRTAEANPILRELRELVERNQQRRCPPPRKATANPILAELAELDLCEDGALSWGRQLHQRQHNPYGEEVCTEGGFAHDAQVWRRSCAPLDGPRASSGTIVSPDTDDAQALRQELEMVKQQLRELTLQTLQGQAGAAGAAPPSPCSAAKRRGSKASGILVKLGGMRSFGRRKLATAPMGTVEEVPSGRRVLVKAGSEKNNMPTCMDLEKICRPEETDVDFDWAPKAELFYSIPCQRIGAKF